MKGKYLILLCCGVSALITALNIYVGTPIFSAVFGFLTLWYGVGYFVFDILATKRNYSPCIRDR